MSPHPRWRFFAFVLGLSAVALVALLLGRDYAHGLASWQPGRDWGGDLKQHWTAARMVEETGFPSLYREFAFSREITRDFHADNFASGKFLDRHDYRYGPVVAWVAWHLRALPYPAWLAGWLTLSLIALAIGWFCLRHQWPTETRGPGGWLGLAAFPPTLYAISIYQNAPLTFGIVAPALLLAAKGHPTSAAALLACAHYKPQLLAFLFLGLLAARQWRAALVLGGVSAAMLLLGLVLCGWEAHVAWIESLLAIMRGQQGDEMATNIPWRGLIATLSPGLAPGTVSLIANGLLLASGALLFAWLQRERHHRPPLLHETLAATLGWWLVFSPHVKPYDLLLGIPATIVLLARANPRYTGWVWAALWAAGGLGVFARFLGLSLAALPLTLWWLLLLAPRQSRP